MHRSNGKTHRRVFRLIVLVWVIGCLGVAPSFAGTVYPTAMGWRTSTPEAQGIKSGVLADMLEKIEAGGYAIQSITVIRHGAMVLDTYFFPFEKREKHIIHSYVGIGGHRHRQGIHQGGEPEGAGLFS
ncbi:MAG: hypothetical protein P8165_11790 [Deltaproteobacteria bacterium]